MIKQDHLKPAKDYSWAGNTKEKIILHTTFASNYQGDKDPLNIRHISYHYIITENGTIFELVPVNRSAWHAGVKSKPNLRVKVFFGDTNPNKRSIGIAFVRRGEQTLTQLQRDAGVWLIKDIGKRTKVRYNADNIFYHQEVTNYKPAEVWHYRNQILEGLFGYRDEKDVGEKTNLRLKIELLQLQIQTLLLKLKLLKTE